MNSIQIINKKLKIKEHFTNKFDLLLYNFNKIYSNFDYWRRRTFKYFFQRGRRGWADNDVWNLDSYLAKVIYESLDNLANNLSGHPLNYTNELWEKKLKEVSQAFKDYYEYDDNLIKRYSELEKKYNIKKINILTEIDKWNANLNNPEYHIPLEVQKKFYEDEEKIKTEIKERMKELINIFDYLWD